MNGLQMCLYIINVYLFCEIKLFKLVSDKYLSMLLLKKCVLYLLLLPLTDFWLTTH